MTLFFDAEDGAQLVRYGTKMRKKPNPVYVQQVNERFKVSTNEGVMTGNPGDYVAHDPISGHVWPVSASYVVQHYELFEDGES